MNHFVQSVCLFLQRMKASVTAGATDSDLFVFLCFVSSRCASWQKSSPLQKNKKKLSECSNFVRALLVLAQLIRQSWAMVLTERQQRVRRPEERGGETERGPPGCLACQIPQLHNSARLARAPAQPVFSTTMGGEAQERPATPGEGRNSLNPGAAMAP